MKMFALLIVVMITSLNAKAQTMVVEMTDGTTAEFDIKKISQVFFVLKEDGGESEGLKEMIVGKWKVVKGAEDYESYILEFKSDGNLTEYSVDSEEGAFTQSNNTYRIDGNKLRIDFNIKNGATDDYTLGIVEMQGRNRATYTFYWYDGNGEWSGDTEETYIMERIVE